MKIVKTIRDLKSSARDGGRMVAMSTGLLNPASPGLGFLLRDGSGFRDLALFEETHQYDEAMSKLRHRMGSTASWKFVTLASIKRDSPIIELGKAGCYYREEHMVVVAESEKPKGTFDSAIHELQHSIGHHHGWFMEFRTILYAIRNYDIYRRYFRP